MRFLSGEQFSNSDYEMHSKTSTCHFWYTICTKRPSGWVWTAPERNGARNTLYFRRNSSLNLSNYSRHFYVKMLFVVHLFVILSPVFEIMSPHGAESPAFKKINITSLEKSTDVFSKQGLRFEKLQNNFLRVYSFLKYKIYIIAKSFDQTSPL